MSRRLPIVLAFSICACVCTASMAHAQEAQEAQQVIPAGAEGSVSALAESPAPAARTPVTAVITPAVATRTPVVVRDPSSIDMSKEYLIGPEDVLDVQVWKNCPDLCRVMPVRPDGKVSMPLVNDVQAAGLTPMELRQHLTEHLSEFLPNPEVSVIVREVHNVKVAVVGAVKVPGD